MIALLKSLAPTSLFIFGVICAILAFAGQIRWALLLVIFLSPLRNIVERMTDFPLGNQFLDLLFATMLFGWLASSIFLRGKFMEKTSLNLLLVILIFYVFISLFVGTHYLYGEYSLDIHDSRVQDAKNFCLLPMLFFLTLNGIKDKKWVHRAFMVMCAAMLIMGYYTTSQVSWFSSLISRAKITGTFQFLGPNEVAAFYDVNTIIMLSIYFFMKKGIKKMVFLGLILLNFYCLLFMYSRAAYAATFVGLFLLFAVKNKKLLIPLFLVLIFWQVALPEKARERIMETRNRYGEYDESAARRLSIWDHAIQIFQENPLAGIGYGSFRTLGLNLGDTHNIYMKIAAEQGIIGLSIMGILLISFFREGYTLYKKGEDDESKGLGLGFAIAVIVLIINNIFGDRWTYYELAAYFWVYAALVVRLNAISNEPKPEPIVNPKTKSIETKLAGSSQFLRRKASAKTVMPKFKRSL